MSEFTCLGGQHHRNGGSRWSGICNNRDSIKTIKFHYSYLGNQGSFKTCRLLLDSINEKRGNQTNFSHKFEYNQGELPPKYSKNIDHWGYYNNGVNNKYWQKLFNSFVPANPNEGALVPTAIFYQTPNKDDISIEKSYNNIMPVIVYGADRSPNATAVRLRNQIGTSMRFFRIFSINSTPHFFLYLLFSFSCCYAYLHLR